MTTANVLTLKKVRKNRFSATEVGVKPDEYVVDTVG